MRPASGPPQAFKGTNCVATVLGFSGGNYAPNTDSRLVSPRLVVPCAEAGPRLLFAHWYDIAADDQGTLQIRLADGGDWVTVLGPVTGSSHDWITGFYDLSFYAGKIIQIAFRFQSNDSRRSSHETRVMPFGRRRV